MKKYLIIRFSSIGDVVLTSPIIRCLKKEHPNAIIHYATKKAFENIVNTNPAIDKVYAIEKEIDEITDQLKAENYDFIIDLHHNLRTFRLKRHLKISSSSFPKENLNKFLLTQLKINRMPDVHIVDRYFKAVEPLNVKNDGNGLDFFIPPSDEVDLASMGITSPFIAIAIGAQFATKRLPLAQLKTLISKINSPILLLGGPSDQDEAAELVKTYPKLIDFIGKINLNQSASILKQSSKVVTHDTGLMHIASAFQVPIISIWGNTVPSFGMYPYMPKNKGMIKIHEVELKCRPCSKIGYQACPKKHFHCMTLQDIDAIAKDVNE